MQRVPDYWFPRGVEEEQVKVHWATDYFCEGNAYGYSLMNGYARDALAAEGVEFSDDAEIAVHACPGYMLQPVEGKVNVLYCCLETPDVPARHVKGYRRADCILASAEFVRDAIRKVVPEVPIYVCPLGVDPDVFTFERRHEPKFVPFRFLWVGAPNARKGWEIIKEAWRGFVGVPQVELYLKTTVTEKQERRGNVIFDSRNLSQKELVELYHSAHCFLFPSYGEGFGLTMAEAMATGLPCIYTHWSALSEFADASCAYPVKHSPVDVWLMPNGGLVPFEDEQPEGAIRTEMAQADLQDFVNQMIRVLQNYREASEKGTKAAQRIRSNFTWKHTGQRLKAILSEVQSVLAEVG